ncbi:MULTISPECIES: hypothetical protein [unclassified Saccharothrix]|uniref:hypothetical protein n=1 Tax=unclassified Saccharothrix TaxID=2593673 RepID=UPI00307EC309
MSEYATEPVQIHDVPVDVVETLRARASAEGLSLDAYLRGALVDLANTPTMAEVFQRTRLQPRTIDVAEYVRVLREIREEE